MSNQGTGIWVQIQSPDENQTPVIVIHGGPGASHLYLKPLEELAVNRPVIFYDQAGCGKSESLADSSKWNLNYFTDELKLLIDSLGYPKVILLGQSWGTTIAVNYLIKYGQSNVTGVILSGPCLNAKQWADDQRMWIEKMPAEHSTAILNAEMSGNYEDSGYQNALNEFYRLHVCRMDVWPDLLMQTFDKLNFKMYSAMWGPSEFTVKGSLKDLNLESELHKVTVPVLITCGEYDEATPETCKRYGKLLKHASVYVLPGASHEHHLEEPVFYLKAVNDFLSTL